MRLYPILRVSLMIKENNSIILGRIVAECLKKF